MNSLMTGSARWEKLPTEPVKAAGSAVEPEPTASINLTRTGSRHRLLLFTKVKALTAISKCKGKGINWKREIRTTTRFHRANSTMSKPEGSRNLKLPTTYPSSNMISKGKCRRLPDSISLDGERAIASFTAEATQEPAVGHASSSQTPTPDSSNVLATQQRKEKRCNPHVCL